MCLGNQGNWGFVGRLVRLLKYLNFPLECGFWKLSNWGVIFYCSACLWWSHCFTDEPGRRRSATGGFSSWCKCGGETSSNWMRGREKSGGVDFIWSSPPKIPETWLRLSEKRNPKWNWWRVVKFWQERRKWLVMLCFIHGGSCGLVGEIVCFYSEDGAQKSHMRQFADIFFLFEIIRKLPRMKVKHVLACL